jgi:hypothetical protein
VLRQPLLAGVVQPLDAVARGAGAGEPAAAHRRAQDGELPFGLRQADAVTRELLLIHGREVVGHASP